MVVVARERAIELVERVLEPSEGIWRVEAHALGWLVRCQSRKWIETRDDRDLYIGAGPYLVDGEDGSVHMIHVVAAQGDEWEAEYRHQVRGLPRPDPLAAEISRVLRTSGRVAAMSQLRSMAGAGLLTLSQAKEYVTALGRGEPPPAELAALAAGPPDTVPFPAFWRISGPDLRQGDACPP
ncbi:YrhB domain-containing protein [Streptomyces sp. NPDC059479]|uniref:YrhB domain-containing protein n=1 Tax=Streptomyces sp. NPDC059479 TaxID=3346848 RepID=UPI0036C2E4FC